jgi:hypothetical protein
MEKNVSINEIKPKPIKTSRIYARYESNLSVLIRRLIVVTSVWMKLK